MFRLVRESRCIQHDYVARLGDLDAYHVCQQCGKVRLPVRQAGAPKDEDGGHLASESTPVLAAAPTPWPKLAA